MKDSIIIALLQNTSILLAFAMLYENFWIQKESSKTIKGKIIAGVVLSAIGVVIMYTTWSWVPGIVFDTRSVMISVAGLFFGLIPTLFTMIATSITRLLIGGAGQWMGIAVIISAGSIGLLWRYLRPNWNGKKYWLELLTMGFLVHFAMALCTLLLPPDRIIHTLQTIAFPLVFIYTPATMLLGMLMVKQFKNKQNKQAHLKLEESEKRLIQVLESGNIVSIILRPDGSIKYCNNYLLQITGYQSNEVLEKNWFDIFLPPHNKDFVYNIFQNSIKNKERVKNMENEITTKDGKLLFFSWYNTSLISDVDTSGGIASIGVNITSIKEYEKALQEKNQRIEIQNQEYKIINQQLKIAKEKAEENERLKTAFLANMSHEIRTPMNGILGFADLLKEGNLSGDEQQEYISIIEKSGDRMLNIINDIICISKIEAGLMSLNVQKTNVNEQIEYIYTFFKPEVENKGMTLSFKLGLPTNKANITTDKEKLYAILTNLVKNAIKYSHLGTIEFGYSVKDNFLEFFVKDTGIGIPVSQQKVIFDRFIQIQNTDSSKYQGAGLGLSITKAYLDMLGGEIWVTSEEGIGSTFFFTLPFENQAMDNDKKDNNQNEITIDTKGNWYPVLVAEDDEISGKYICTILKKYFNNLFCVKNGKEAVQFCVDNPDVKLIFMDIQMPDMDGYEASKQIKSISKEIIIIAQTAFALEGDREKIMQHAFDDYITKPINQSELNQILSKYVN